MKFSSLLLILILYISCQHAPKKVDQPEPQLNILDSVALAYGYENWNKVNSIAFTFNVARPDRTYQRSWKWDIPKQEVTSIIEGDTAIYARSDVDSTLLQADARFINDKYWLLVPFNLVWDRDNFTYSISEKDTAPLSQVPLRKLTIVYGDAGGYTPGDAYDFYLTDKYTIKEWAWRKGNDSIAGVRTIWSDPKSFGGLRLSEFHMAVDSTRRIFFTGIDVQRLEE